MMTNSGINPSLVVGRYLESALQDKAAKVPKALQGLAAEALKYDTYAEFEKAFSLEIKHGTYWHWTEDPNFTIDLSKGPRDMSSLSTGKVSEGKLMVTSHLRAWSDYGPGEKGRPYAALIDMSDVPKGAYYQVKRGFGNEFFVSDPSRAKVIAVYPRQRAFQVDTARHQALPNSKEELEEFYNKVRGVDSQTPKTASEEKTVYHGTSIPLNRFSLKNTAQGILWFSEDRGKIEKGESGAQSAEYIVTAKIKVNKTAGWPEYEKLLLAQIKSMGYDSIHLDDDWVIFDPKNARVVKVEEKQPGGGYKDISR
jgi:hypothetical protein